MTCLCFPVDEGLISIYLRRAYVTLFHHPLLKHNRERMQDDMGLGQVKNMSLHDSHSVTPVDGTDLIKIIQSKFSSAGHLIIMNRVSKSYIIIK